MVSMLRASLDATYYTGGETTIDGNTVVLEQQTLKAAEISESYQLAAQLYGKGHQLLGLAVGSPR
ncbi:MAG: hypothetical protein NWQ32_13675 [Paracoccaceae bacterium]|nr:hypothetical protein [Paracoccaceae bacterium]